MPIIQIILFLIVVGVLLWLANSFLPMDAKIKQILNAFVVVLVVLWLLLVMMGWAHLANIRIGA